MEDGPNTYMERILFELSGHHQRYSETQLKKIEQLKTRPEECLTLLLRRI